jgi:hypothetical protein
MVNLSHESFTLKHHATVPASFWQLTVPELETLSSSSIHCKGKVYLFAFPDHGRYILNYEPQLRKLPCHSQGHRACPTAYIDDLGPFGNTIPRES